MKPPAKLTKLETKLLDALQRFVRETEPETTLLRLVLRMNEVADNKNKEKFPA